VAAGGNQFDEFREVKIAQVAPQEHKALIFFRFPSEVADKPFQPLSFHTCAICCVGEDGTPQGVFTGLSTGLGKRFFSAAEELQSLFQ
jgi:hypothetical protein